MHRGTKRGRDLSLTMFEALKTSPEDFEKRMASDPDFKEKIDAGVSRVQQMKIEDKLRVKFRRLR
jgi:hypothetical protein